MIEEKLSSGPFSLIGYFWDWLNFIFFVPLAQDRLAVVLLKKFKKSMGRQKTKEKFSSGSFYEWNEPELNKTFFKSIL